MWASPSITSRSSAMASPSRRPSRSRAQRLVYRIMAPGRGVIDGRLLRDRSLARSRRARAGTTGGCGCPRSAPAGCWRSVADGSVDAPSPTSTASRAGWVGRPTATCSSWRWRARIVVRIDAAGDQQLVRRPDRRSRRAGATTWSSTRAGNAYVGDFGYDLLGGAPPAPGVLALARPTARSRSSPTTSTSRTAA